MRREGGGLRAPFRCSASGQGECARTRIAELVRSGARDHRPRCSDAIGGWPARDQVRITLRPVG